VTGPVVDAHMHIYPSRASSDRALCYDIWEYGAAPDGVGAEGLVGDLASLVATMEHVGLTNAVVLNMPPAPGAEAVAGEDWAEDRGMAESNLGFLAATADDERLIPFVGINPLALPGPRLTEHVRACAERGARGVKLHPPVHGYRPDDSRLDPLYATCIECDLVVLSHSGPAKDPCHGAEPDVFGTVVDRHPALQLQLAHLGGASWPLARQLAEAHPSVVWDLCELIEWVGTPKAPTAAEMTRLLRDIGVDRVLLGSDFPWYDPALTIERVDSLPGLSASEKAAILGDNAARLLDL
jgi:predicted TIM-barrel fold metal-dependent hydrolase